MDNTKTPSKVEAVFSLLKAKLTVYEAEAAAAEMRINRAKEAFDKATAKANATRVKVAEMLLKVAA